MNWIWCSIFLFSLSCCSACGDSPRQATMPVAMSTEDKNSFIEVNRQLVEKDHAIIEQYIRDNKLAMQAYDNGAFGMIIKQGEGVFGTNETVLKLKATVSLLTGDICYKDTTIAFVPGKTVAISGLHDVAKLLQKGTLATFIFPPSLTYGIYGDGNRIPQRSILRYDVEVLSVTKNE